MKQVKKSEVRKGQYYLVYFNKEGGRHEAIIAKPTYFHRAKGEKLEIEWEPFYGIAISREYQTLKIYDVTVGLPANTIHPLEIPFCNEDEDEFFELSDDEILKHVVAESI
jgi:hypothetical protein